MLRPFEPVASPGIFSRHGLTVRCAPLTATFNIGGQQYGTKLCVKVCSGLAITPGEIGVPNFDREKCVHCGACLWNCATASPENP